MITLKKSVVLQPMLFETGRTGDKPFFTKKLWNEYYKVKEITNISKHLQNHNQTSPVLSHYVKLFTAGQSILRDTRARLKKQHQIKYEFTLVHPTYGTFKQEFLTNEYSLLSIMPQLKAAKDALRNNIRAKRLESRQLRERIRPWRFNNRSGERAWTHEVRTQGGVHIAPNTILDLLSLRNSQKIFEYKSPTIQDNHVGVELEFFCKGNQQELAIEFQKAGLASFLTLKTDGSIKPNKPDYKAHEIAILATENVIQSVINKVIPILLKYDARVNASCGMHVHLDMRNRNREIVFSNLVSSQPILYAMNPRERLNSKFSQKTKSKKFTMDGERYLGINPTAMKRHGTIEVRIHAGTVNERKINNWISLLISIVNKKEEIKRAPRTFKTFIKAFDVNLDLATYIAERIQKFNVPEDVTVPEEAA